VALTVKSHIEDRNPAEIDTKAAANSSTPAKASIQPDGLNDRFIESLLEKFQTTQSLTQRLTQIMSFAHKWPVS
jgi:hypothetical protein